MQPPPASINGGSTSILIDEGTLARAESPTLDAVGLDAKGGSPASRAANMADRVVSYARHRLGQRVGDGERFALADRALRRAGAKSAADFGTVTPTADYVWGTAVSLSDVRRGDVIQFRDYRYDREVVAEDTSGTTFETDFQERPHHTAIVEQVGDEGAITVLEQNAPVGDPVTRNQLFFSSVTTASGNRTTTITVRGTFWFYRAQAR
mgnify:FL=1|jgi:hypothetical protein